MQHFELLTYLSAQLKADRAVQLPLQELLSICANAESSEAIKVILYSLCFDCFLQRIARVYVKLGFERCEDKIQWLPLLLQCLTLALQSKVADRDATITE